MLEPELLALLADHYGLAGATLELLSGGAERERAVYRVPDGHGASWALRAYRATARLPEHLRGCGAPDPATFLRSRATTLAFLERQGYPAPRVRPTRGGALVAEAGGWCCLVTTFVAGDRPGPTPDVLRALGEAVGRLHRLPCERTAPGALGTSYWPPGRAIADTLARLEAGAGVLPTMWRPVVAAYGATLRELQGEPALPTAIVHGDAWVGNAVVAPGRPLVLIDWDVAGLGAAALDLGRLLVGAHWGREGPPPLLEPDSARIAAVLDGYCRARRPAAAERERLLAATRFGVVFVAANHIGSLAAGAGGGEASDAILHRTWAWYEACVPIAAIAEARLRTGG
ncbi:MAG TPA: phosphotransferase [Thermomicrobiales bacterium]|nr:phosphotransferase [Thermomicrobiales bacterium]